MKVMPVQWQGEGRLRSSGRLMRSLLLLLNLVLLLVMVWLWRNTPPAVSVKKTPEVQASLLELPASPLRSLSLANYQEVLVRPIFWSERRAQESASPVESATPSPPLAFVLIGVVTSPQSQYALLGKTGSAEVIKAQPGDVVEGWELEAMTADSVSLSRSGEQRQILLNEDRSKEH